MVKPSGQNLPHSQSIFLVPGPEWNPYSTSVRLPWQSGTIHSECISLGQTRSGSMMQDWFSDNSPSKEHRSTNSNRKCIHQFLWCTILRWSFVIDPDADHLNGIHAHTLSKKTVNYLAQDHLKAPNRYNHIVNIKQNYDLLYKPVVPFTSLFLCWEGEACIFRVDPGLAWGTCFLLELGDASGCLL